MQMLLPKGIANRFLYYWAGVYRDQLTEGEDYSRLQQTISILFLNKKLFKETDDYHLMFELVNRGHGIVFSDHLQLHTIELEKFNVPADKLRDPLEIWCYFLRHATSLDPSALPEALKVKPILRAI
jgi:predicted transposase/invertase (TIGR01784 family)